MRLRRSEPKLASIVFRQRKFLPVAACSYKYLIANRKYQDPAFTFSTGIITLQRIQLRDVRGAIVAGQIDAAALNELEIIA